MSKSEIYRKRIQKGEQPVKESYGDWFCLKCVKTVEDRLHNNCNYEAVWIESELKKEIAELKDKLAAAEKVVNVAKTLDSMDNTRDFSEVYDLLHRALKEHEEASK